MYNLLLLLVLQNNRTIEYIYEYPIFIRIEGNGRRLSPVYYKICLIMIVLIRVARIWQNMVIATLSTDIILWYLIGNSFPSIVLLIYNI